MTESICYISLLASGILSLSLCVWNHKNGFCSDTTVLCVYLSCATEYDTRLWRSLLWTKTQQYLRSVLVPFFGRCFLSLFRVPWCSKCHHCFARKHGRWLTPYQPSTISGWSFVLFSLRHGWCQRGPLFPIRGIFAFWTGWLVAWIWNIIYIVPLQRRHKIFIEKSRHCRWPWERDYTQSLSRDPRRLSSLQAWH